MRSKQSYWFEACLPTSPDPSAYCQARQRLPEGLFRRLVHIVSERRQAQVPKRQLWQGHRVFLVDGSTTLLPDTPENQAAYPQQANQAEGCGFPLARFVCLFSMDTAAVQDVQIGSYHTHELTLARSLYQPVQPGDVVMGDSLFGTYGDIAPLQQQGLNVVFCMHGARSVDFRRGQKLGPHDHLVEWHKPRCAPAGISAEQFARLPDKLQLRELPYTIQPHGGRAKKITLATTFLDPGAYPQATLAALFARRWEAELDLRHLKTTLGMERLTTHTPAMIRKELLTPLLASNRIRSLLWDAGHQEAGDPLRLSLQNALRHLRHFLPELAQASPRRRRRLYKQLLFTIARQVVPKRPRPSQPRMRKRRPKPFPLMKKPRAISPRKLAA